ncbi:hypothetical protein ACH5A3_02895 [Streptomyces echinatus]|uniref:hypothetical protein n=1 Tax=Streptomyces echinatus TaxID=67293 RepID=UPI0037B07248
MTDTPPPEPTIHVTVVQQQPEEKRWDWTWLQFGRNTKAVLLSVVTAPWWAAGLQDVRESQHQPGAWFMAGAAFCAALWLDHTRQRFVTRVLVWTTALGAAGALPVFSELVRLMTGSPA